MVTTSIIKHLLSDTNSLHTYLAGKTVDWDMIKVRLLLLERQENRHIPDHYYRLNQEKSLEDIDSLGDLIRKGLYRLAKKHLEMRDKRLYVYQQEQTSWQELITYITPLLLQAAYLHITCPLTDFKPGSLTDYFRKYILPNSRYTALLHPYIPQLENYIQEKRGLHDLHMHLNGSTETDIAWQDFLHAPEEVYTFLIKKSNEEKVKEQLEQEGFPDSHIEFNKLLLCAKGLRFILYKMIFEPSDNDFWDTVLDNSTEELIRYVMEEVDPTRITTSHLIAQMNNEHPFARLLGKDAAEPLFSMPVENLMYVIILTHLAKYPSQTISSVFHFYLLIVGFCNRLLVQQVHQYGFEQFQKITLNDLRENSEKTYLRRFLQLHGNDRRNIRFLEGRFAPKDTEKKNRDLLNAIHDGWKNLQEDIEKELNLQPEELPRLTLTAHFIKIPDTSPDSSIRYKKLRYDIWKRAQVLVTMKKNDPGFMEWVKAVDAAASEFDTPPEVFAPAFRYLRRKGFKHFTYHAGEDFFHILSGLRAIYEAVEFHGLGCGDRIGHATAAGVSPALWVKNIGKRMFIRQGEYMDNLIFAYHLILKQEIKSLKPLMLQVTHKIMELSYKIYKKSYALKALEDAWLFRRYCPVNVFERDSDSLRLLAVYDYDEWHEITTQLFGVNKDERVEILEKYHSKECTKEYNEIIEIDVLEFFDASLLEVLQREILKLLHKKEIVVETLPTSNVRIGQHHNFGSYHLWNWIKWEKEGHPIPPIVVGTDDTGIFATNIYNEYANIYCHLTSGCHMTHWEAMQLLEKLDRNARIYRFE